MYFRFLINLVTFKTFKDLKILKFLNAEKLDPPSET